jgi:hypothetical protein
MKHSRSTGSEIHFLLILSKYCTPVPSQRTPANALHEDFDAGSKFCFTLCNGCRAPYRPCSGTGRSAANRRRLFGGADGTPGGFFASAATATGKPVLIERIIDAGHQFFGGISRGLVTIVEKAVSQWGLPNGYILGQEASGAFIGGLRYGEGTLYSKNARDVRVFWQGPSVVFDYGADGDRTMMLVYNLPQAGAIFDRFLGVAGSAYFVYGLGMTTLSSVDLRMALIILVNFKAYGPHQAPRDRHGLSCAAR